MNVGSCTCPRRIFLQRFTKSKQGSSHFQILYGMHPRGVHELQDLGQLERRSVDREDFTKAINDLHEQVKSKL